MATGPQPGDLIIRNTITLHFEVLTIDGGRIAGPFESFAAARIRAQLTADGATVWQQAVDVRGRALGVPVPVPPAPVHLATVPSGG